MGIEMKIRVEDILRGFDNISADPRSMETWNIFPRMEVNLGATPQEVKEEMNESIPYIRMYREYDGEMVIDIPDGEKK